MLISLATGKTIDQQIEEMREVQKRINIEIGLLIVQKVAQERCTAVQAPLIRVPKLGYVSLKVEPVAAARLFQFMKSMGVQNPIKPEDMHLTLMYDRSNPMLAPVSSSACEPHHVKVKGVKRLGEKGSKWEAIALELDAPSVVQRHEYLRLIGLTHSYAEYIPHISVCYRPKESDLDFIAERIDQLTEYMGKFMLVDETWEPVKED